MARKKRAKKESEPAALEMTPMIDVVFQLLIFFLVTLKPEDVIAQLDVSRPAPDSSPPVEEPQDMLTITVGGFIDLNGTRMSLPHLQKTLNRLASYNSQQTVLVKCTLDSRHELLIQVLDATSQAGLKNISVFTL